MESRKKVVVIEDDKDINRLISYTLEKEGFNVSSIYDGMDAQLALARELFDIVILDLMLPSVDGYTICQEVKKRHPLLPFVIIISAKAKTLDKARAYLLGADYYLTKPFSIEKLRSIVKELCAMADTA